jgi:hypothetical protein
MLGNLQVWKKGAVRMGRSPGVYGWSWPHLVVGGAFPTRGGCAGEDGKAALEQDWSGTRTKGDC